MSGAYCDDEVIHEKITHAIEIAKTVEFNSNSYVYLNNVYDKLAEVMRSNSSFMKDLECLSIYNMMKALLTDLRKYDGEENIPLDKIRSGDILLIKCPSIFASYHFIIAVVNPDKTEVSVFQSYGSYKKLHKIVLSYSEFKKLLEDLKRFKDADFDTTYPMMINVEEKLYGINEREYIARLEAHLKETNPNTPENNNYNQRPHKRLRINNSNNSGNNNSENNNSENNSYVQRAEQLKIHPEIYEDLEYKFNINPSKLVINAYRVLAGGRKKPTKTKKDKTKRKTKKSKKIKTKTMTGKKNTMKRKKNKSKKSTSKKNRSKKNRSKKIGLKSN